MATSISCNTPLWVDGPPIDAQAPLRQYDIGSRVYNAGTTGAVQIPGGVFPGNGAMFVTAGSGMSVSVAAGFCCVPNSSSALQGGYIFGLLNAGTLTIAAADPANQRDDLIVARVYDTGTAASSCDVEVVTGTASPSPALPVVPANSIPLAFVQVPAGSSSVTSANVGDLRSFVVAPGGVLPIQSASSAPAAPASQIMYDISTGTLVQGTGSAGSVSPIPVLPWAPVVSVTTSPVSDSASRGSLTQITTASVTTDGATDIEVYYKWPGLTASVPPLLVTMQVAIDGVTLDQTVTYPASGSVFTCGGGVKAFTSAGQSNTPSAGTHVVSFSFQSASTSATTTVNGSGTALGILRVAPVSI